MSLKTRAIRRFGSAAYDLALVADGRFDGYWEMSLNLWDIAAGALIIEESGGRLFIFGTIEMYRLSPEIKRCAN